MLEKRLGLIQLFFYWSATMPEDEQKNQKRIILPRVVTVPEAARLLGLSPCTVIALFDSKHLDGYSIFPTCPSGTEKKKNRRTIRIFQRSVIDLMLAQEPEPVT